MGHLCLAYFFSKTYSSNIQKSRKNQNNIILINTLSIQHKRTYQKDTERLQKHCRNDFIETLQYCMVVTKRYWIIVSKFQQCYVRFLLYCNKTFQQYCNVMYFDKFFRRLKWKLFLYIYLTNFNFSTNHISSDMCFPKAVFYDKTFQ